MVAATPFCQRPANHGLCISPDMVTAMRQIEIRKETGADAVPPSGLIRRTIRVSNSKEYDQQSIDLLCSNFEPEQVAKRIANELILLCIAGIDLIGTAGLKRDFLRLLFVEPTYQRQGLGKVLVASIEEMARHKLPLCGLCGCRANVSFSSLSHFSTTK